VKDLSSFLKKINYKKQPDSNLVVEIKQKQNYIKNNCPNNEEETKAKISDMIKSAGNYTTVLNKNRVDLTIKHNNKPVAIFEVKAPKNSNEMISLGGINRKALHEIIINLLETQERGDLPLYAVITNGMQWYVISSESLLLFISEIENPYLRNALGLSSGKGQTLPFPQQLDLKKDKYIVLSQYLKNETDFLMQCAKNMLIFSKPEDVALFLSEDVFAGQYNPNVGNKLNSDFYGELLYIFGLKEVKRENKKQIVPNEVSNTFYHQISSKLNMKNPPPKEDELYEKALELIIIWLNRILFLKLFEGRLILFNSGDKRFRFMNADRITTTTKLKQLFFEVLAVPEDKRANHLFKDIPYLNSSLFEEKPIEGALSISDIAGDDEIPYYDSTVLSETNGKKKKGNVKLLNYLFEFLDAFDFSSETVKNLITQSSLISPAVLGLIFEKINGYKDGSYYTPTTITDYMADTAIKGAIVSKVNRALNRQFEDYAKLKTAYFNPQGLSMKEKVKVEEIINNLRILDPAVGSGHFLVSALNVLFYIKWSLDLGAEINKSNLNLSRFNVFFDGGDLFFTDRNEPFVYRRDDRESQAFQEYLFNTKQFIIENSLFGVDINPKAVEIARLRMWIELLKNTYYKPDGTMETLPNIDINIKQGNSLLASIVERNTGLFPANITELKKLHKQYKETTWHEKYEIEQKIQEWRAQFIRESHIESNYNDLIWTIDFPETINDNGDFIGFDIIVANPPYIKEYTNRKAFTGLRESPYYQGKMDIWYLFACKGIDMLRDNSGVLAFIAQNNWVTSYGASKLRNKVIKSTRILKLLDFGDYKIFEKAGIQTMVMMFKRDDKTDNYRFDYRRLAANHGCFQDILDLLNKKSNQNIEYLMPVISRSKYLNMPLTFNNLTIENILKKICKQSNFKIYGTEIAQGIVCPQDYVIKRTKKKLGNQFNIRDGIFVLNNNEKNSIPFTKKEKELIKPYYTTKELERYRANKNNSEWIIYTDSRFKNPISIKPYPNIKKHLDKFQKIITSDNKPYGLHRARDAKFFRGEKIISVRKCAKPAFTYTDFECYVSAAFYVIKTKRVNSKYLTGLLNSKLIEFYLRYKGKMQGNNYQIDKEPLLALPIIKPADKKQKKVIDIVDKILSLTKDEDYLENPTKQVRVKGYEQQIDQMVYNLHNLTPEEIKTVEESVK